MRQCDRNSHYLVMFGPLAERIAKAREVFALCIMFPDEIVSGRQYQ